MSVAVRDAILEDVNGIACTHVQGWRESYGGLLSAEALAGLSVEERIRMWQGAFAHIDPQARCLVAQERNGEVVGFARAGPVRGEGPVPLGTQAEIYAIYLLDRVKRQGVGRRLMAGLFDHLTRQGFASAGLWVLSGNAVARRFYEALGGRAGPEQPLSLGRETVMETSYRFEPIPRL